MDELLIQYADAFGENFPIFMCMGMDENDLKVLINKCLDDGVPYDPDDLGERVDY